MLLASTHSDGGFFESLWTHLTQAYYGTWVFDLYMPLFSWSVSREALIFGGNATPYFVENVLLFGGVCALAHLIYRQLLGPGAALVASLLLGLNPWTVNNVAWMVGRCSVVSAGIIFLGLLLHLRRIREEKHGLPVGIFVLTLIGVYYRQTTAFLPVFIFLIDICNRRWSGQDFKRWVFLSIPVFAYMASCQAVIGSWAPSYDIVQKLTGMTPLPVDEWQVLADLRVVVGNLLFPGDMEGAVGWDGLRTCAAIGLSVALVLGAGGMWKRRQALLVMLAFALVYGLPIFNVDRVLHADSTQRWFAVIWAVSGLMALVFRGVRWPAIAFVALVAVVGSNAVRQCEVLESYEEASIWTRRIQDAIAEAPHEKVFVYQLTDSLGAAPFFTVGLGQTQMPPLRKEGEGRTVFPVFANMLFSEDPNALLPIGYVLRERGEPVTVLRLVHKDQKVVELDPFFSRVAKKHYFDDLDRLALQSPARSEMGELADLELRFDATGLVRVDIFLVSPLGAIHVVRVKGGDYERATWDENDLFTEDLSRLLEFASFLSGPAKGESFLFVAGHEIVDGRAPRAISDIIRFRSIHPQGKRH